MWKDDIIAQLNRIEDRQREIAHKLDKALTKLESAESAADADRKMQEGIANLMAYDGPKAGDA